MSIIFLFVYSFRMRRKRFRKAPSGPFSSRPSSTCCWHGWQELASSVTPRVPGTFRYSPSLPLSPATTITRVKLQSPWRQNSSLYTVPFTTIAAGLRQLSMEIQLLECKPLRVYRVPANTDCKTTCRYKQFSSVQYKHPEA